MNEITVTEIELFTTIDDDGQKTKFRVVWSDGSTSDYAEAINIIADVVSEIIREMEESSTLH